jgi:hypothetical protein
MFWCARAVVASIVVLGAARTSFAQHACYAIERGETAASVAQRITGNAGHREASWFQIVDQRWKTIAKSEYNRIRPGWLACVDQGRHSIVLPLQPAGGDRARGIPEQPQALLFEYVDPAFVIVGVLCVAAAALLRLVPRYTRARRARAELLRQFADEFVAEFVRPLTHFRGAHHALRARYRVRPRRSQVDVLLAPRNGCVYPNLSDHRANVEYDVARVMAVLDQSSFISGRPYAEGQWVVLPFQFSGSVMREGLR